MKIGIIVDGQAEYYSLPTILERINTQATIFKPLYCDLQPFATPAQNAHRAMKTISILLRGGVSRVILLIDKETRHECTANIVSDFESELARRLANLAPNVQVYVVLKVSTFENWLVADPQAFSRLTGLFRQRNRIRRAVEPDKADNVNALALLKRCSVSGSFDKVRGAKAICNKLDPQQAARNSRSFRRLLRVLGDPAFSDQSKRPID